MVSRARGAASDTAANRGVVTAGLLAAQEDARRGQALFGLGQLTNEVARVVAKLGDHGVDEVVLATGPDTEERIARAAEAEGQVAVLRAEASSARAEAVFRRTSNSPPGLTR